MEKKSRAEYFRKRRETKPQFMVMVEKELLEQLDIRLKEKNQTRTAWLKEQIEKELYRVEEG